MESREKLRFNPQHKGQIFHAFKISTPVWYEQSFVCKSGIYLIFFSYEHLMAFACDRIK